MNKIRDISHRCDKFPREIIINRIRLRGPRANKTIWLSFHVIKRDFINVLFLGLNRIVLNIN